MGPIRQIFREILDKGLRAINNEINETAPPAPLMMPQPQEGHSSDHVRAGFESLNAFLTGQSDTPNPNGGIR